MKSVTLNDPMKTYSLLELCTLIQSNVESSLPAVYRVVAEVSSMNIHGGHCYMELVEKSHDSSILSAKIRATCWSNVWELLSAYFFHETGQRLSAGMQVLVEAEVRFHPVFGLSLQISGIDPSFTLGDLARQRQKTIQRLQDEGVLTMQQLLALPSLPKRVAVISSAEAAGYGDFMHQLQSSGYDFLPALFPAIMQGDRSAASIISALDKVYAELKNFDVVVIIRGGGATTDMSCFDNYELAFHITQFPIPIITGIGHQRDVSVADIVACVSEKTPTAVAERLIGLMQKQQDIINQLCLRMHSSADKRLSIQREKLKFATLMVRNAFINFLSMQSGRISMAEKTIILLSPIEIFKKGYTITKMNGKVVKSVDEIDMWDTITTEFADGAIESRIVRKQKLVH